MSNIICVTNRRLCRTNFLYQIEKIAEAGPMAIILREKDLSREEYRNLAKSVLSICKKYETPCIIHSFVNVAKELHVNALHLPLSILRTLPNEEKGAFKILGASCHSVEEAQAAEALGCTYITAGHIFDTDCKKGLPGRGLEFLKRVCNSVSIPVYAIGGITQQNLSEVMASGAAGACVMSAAMLAKDPRTYILNLKCQNHLQSEFNLDRA